MHPLSSIHETLLPRPPFLPPLPLRSFFFPRPGSPPLEGPQSDFYNLLLVARPHRRKNRKIEENNGESARGKQGKKAPRDASLARDEFCTLFFIPRARKAPPGGEREKKLGASSYSPRNRCRSLPLPVYLVAFFPSFRSLLLRIWFFLQGRREPPFLRLFDASLARVLCTASRR